MTIKVIQMHEALDGSSHTTLKQAQKHNSILKEQAFQDLRTIVSGGLYLFDEEGEQSSDLVHTLISNKEKVLYLLKLL